MHTTILCSCVARTARGNSCSTAYMYGHTSGPTPHKQASTASQLIIIVIVIIIKTSYGEALAAQGQRGTWLGPHTPILQQLYGSWGGTVAVLGGELRNVPQARLEAQENPPGRPGAGRLIGSFTFDRVTL